MNKFYKNLNKTLILHHYISFQFYPPTLHTDRLKTLNMEKVIYKDLGRISYQDAWDYQQEKLKEVIDRKLKNRNLNQLESIIRRR